MSAEQPLTSDYLAFYQYLPVLTPSQITKLRQIATGALDISAFTDEEIGMLESQLTVQ